MKLMPQSSCLERLPALKILLAAEDAELRRLLGLVLERDGHDVVEVRDSGELFETLAATVAEPTKRTFDLMICEQSLPGIRGLTVLAGLRSRAAPTAVVLITSDTIIAAQARRLGATILADPFRLQAVRDAVSRSTAWIDMVIAYDLDPETRN